MRVEVIGLKPDVQSIGLNGVKDFKLASAKVCRHPATLFNGDTAAVCSTEFAQRDPLLIPPLHVV